ncbi:MAG TPA: hypothetical protein VF026_02315 [Ktedonobacteraceae bacterium]
MNIQDVVTLAQENDLRLVRFLYCDNGGIIRGKATHASRLASRVHEGIGQSLAMQAFTGVESGVSTIARPWYACLRRPGDRRPLRLIWS